MNIIENKKHSLDHKVIGKNFGFFFNDNAIGSQTPFIAEKGALVIQILRRFIEEQEYKRGLILVQSPLVSHASLFETSGHLSHYENLFFDVHNNNKKLVLRPVTCPFHFTYYKHNKHHYSELPIGFFETTFLFRKCKTGESNGLFRTQHFTIGDSHIICRESQIQKELANSIEYIIQISKALGIWDDIIFVFSSGATKNMDFIGNDSEWELSRKYLVEALASKEIHFHEDGNTAAFYGPKIDVYFKSHSSNVALFTIQLDLQLAKNFNMTYTNERNLREYPAIIHRSSISSYERLLGVLLEKYEGDLPFWLSPVQIKIFIVDASCVEYGVKICNDLIKIGFRAKTELITRSKLSSKIKDEIFQKTHYIAVVGRKELEQNKISLRFYRDSESNIIGFDDLVKEITSKKYAP